jgi:hypothetical protein
MGLIDDIKNDVRKSGTNKKKVTYFKPGVKVRIRFLEEMDDGMKILFHDSFDQGVNFPCQELYDRECDRHEDETLRHRNNYVWSVWNYDTKEVELLLGPVNNYSPIPLLMGMHDAYSTIMDRDYVITKNGKGTDQTWAVVPMDKSKFRNEKAKPLSEAKTLSVLDKAFPCDTEEEDEDYKSKSKKKKKQAAEEDDDDEDYVPKKKAKKKPVDDDDDEDDEEAPRKKKKVVPDEDDDEEDEAPRKKRKAKKPDYEDMTARELYDECVERDINVKPRKDEEYYIEKLEEDDDLPF